MGAGPAHQGTSQAPCFSQQLGAINCGLQNPEYFCRKNAQFVPNATRTSMAGRNNRCGSSCYWFMTRLLQCAFWEEPRAFRAFHSQIFKECALLFPLQPPFQSLSLNHETGSQHSDVAGWREPSPFLAQRVCELRCNLLMRWREVCGACTPAWTGVLGPCVLLQAFLVGVVPRLLSCNVPRLAGG